MNKSIVYQFTMGLIAGAFAAIFMFLLIAGFNKAIASEPLDNCHTECAVSIPWCYSWKWKGCTKWGTKCLEHKLVCELPDPTPTPEPSAEPSATPEATPIPDGSTPATVQGSTTEASSAWREPTSCTAPLPKVAVNPKYSRNGDTVGISWLHDGGVKKWSINYGYTPDNMPYGVPYLPSEARSIDLHGITWSPVQVAICGYSSDDCQACMTFDP